MSTTAPLAPRTRSSHMNQNRSWPGVPNRYSTRSEPRLMRPKSMATVVVVLVATLLVSSTPSLTLVMAASVVSGSISLIEPTKVVLPTAKPPATTILTGSGAAVGPYESASEGLETIEHPFQETEAGTVPSSLRTVEVDEAFVSH